MDDFAAAAAAGTIWSHWQSGTKIGALPPQQRPADRGEGYAIQARLAALSSRPPLGWKIAATSVAGQRHIGVSGPIAGRLLAERCHENGAELSLRGNAMLVAEPEFAFRLGRDLPPRGTLYATSEVLAAVASLHAAVEIPDSRFAAFEQAGEAQLIADNACAHDFMLGPAAAADWRGLDLSTFPTRGVIEGKLDREGNGGNVLGDPRVALAWLVNEVTGLGLTVGAGEVVTTGTSAVPMAIAPGDRVVADLGVLGQARVSFTA